MLDLEAVDPSGRFVLVREDATESKLPAYFVHDTRDGARLSRIGEDFYAGLIMVGPYRFADNWPTLYRATAVLGLASESGASTGDGSEQAPDSLVIHDVLSGNATTFATTGRVEAFDDDRGLVAMSNASSLDVIDVADGDTIYSSAEPGVKKVHFLERGKHAVIEHEVDGRSGLMRIVDLETGRTMIAASRMVVAAIEFGGPRFATVDLSDGRMDVRSVVEDKIVHMETPRTTSALSHESPDLYGIAFDVDGDWLLTNFTGVHDSRTGALIHPLFMSFDSIQASALDYLALTSRSVADGTTVENHDLRHLRGLLGWAQAWGAYVAHVPEVVLPSAPVRAPLTVVVDPAHGGDDPGPSYVPGEGEDGTPLVAKDLTLAFALRLAEALEDEDDIDVILTRRSDVAATDAERAAFAEEQGANLLLRLDIATGAGTGARAILPVVTLSYDLGDLSTAEGRAALLSEDAADDRVADVRAAIREWEASAMRLSRRPRYERIPAPGD